MSCNVGPEPAVMSDLWRAVGSQAVRVLEESEDRGGRWTVVSHLPLYTTGRRHMG